MAIGAKIPVQRFVTQYKFLAGKRLSDMERLLGFHTGRLRLGATIATLDRLPTADEFATSGYSQVAGHRHVTPPDLDMKRIKTLAMSAWSMSGSDRLIKVFATTRHDPSLSDDDQYPPGLGVPQWKIVSPVPGTVVVELGRSSAVFRL